MDYYSPDCMEKEKTRLVEIDNIKGILICLVVFGHLCKTTANEYLEVIYNIIYLFHMPAFVFISGLCCSKNEKIITGIKKYLFPWMLFQCFYIFYLNFLSGENIKIQFYIPLWHLWYLVAMFFWHMIIRFFDVKDTKKKVILLSLSVLAALLFGYDSLFSNFLSISRTVVLFPFFLAGYYLKGKELFRKYGNKEKGAIIFVTAVIIVGMYIFRDSILSKWFYHKVPYMTGNYNIGIRLMIFVAATIIILLLCMNVSNRKIVFLTNAGVNSMSIFLLHGIVIFAFRNIEAARIIGDRFPILLILITFLTTYLLSRRFVVKMLDAVLKGPFKLFKRGDSFLGST